MATSIVWGKDSGADIKLPFAGNAALVGTRIINAGVGDDVALAFNEYVPDEYTVGLWHMNEEVWTGAEGEVEDASGNGHDGTAINGATTTVGWLGRSGLFDRSNKQYVEVPYAPDLNPPIVTGEAWCYWDGTGNGKYRCLFSDRETYRGWCIYIAPDGRWEVYIGIGDRWVTFYGGSATPQVWHHVALVIDDTETATLYVDGATAGGADVSGYVPNSEANTLIGDAMGQTGPTTFWWAGMIDEVRISSVPRYSSDFSPHRFEPGTVTLQYNIAAAPLKAIDWSLSTSIADGRVTKVEVYNPSTQQWATLAEDAHGLQPPIYVSGVYVQGPDLVRLTLAPRNDSLQSETPVLDWVRVVLGEDITIINQGEIIWGRNTGVVGGVSLSWSEHSTGSGVRVVNENEAEDDVALAFNEHEPDEYTIGLWHMNEEAWTGAEGEVIDSSGNGHHGTIANPSTTAQAMTVDGWLARSGQFYGRTMINIAPELPFYHAVTVEGWLKAENPVGGIPLVMYGPLCLSLHGYAPHSKVAVDILYDSGSGWKWASVEAEWPGGPTSWVHLAGIADNGTLRLYVNGTLIDETASYTENVPSARTRIGLYYDRSHSDDRIFLVDEVRISNGVRYTSDFSPHRYEPGAITAQYALPYTRTLTAIDWGGLFGSYGCVTQVSVYSNGEWITIAEDPNGITPPLTGLAYAVKGPDIVRLSLQPSGDTLQSQTPILDWLRITLRNNPVMPSHRRHNSLTPSQPRNG